MNKIYDCFTFYNEFELLEIRFKELYNKVDHFVIVESNQTFTNRKKPWNFDITKYPDYADKIIHIQVEDMPNTGNAWDNETHQRDCILRGTLGADDNDIIIISDADEIPRAEVVARMRNSEQLIFALRMPLFNFKFNYMRKTPGEYTVWPMAARKSVFDNITPNVLRSMRFNFNDSPYNFVNDGCEVVEHAGWHFSYLGNKEYLIDKAQSFSHTEVNNPEFLAHIDIEASIRERKEWNRTQSAQYEIVELDDYFPKILQDQKYKMFVLDSPMATVHDILPFF